jgi:hypothetical protein
MGATLDLYIDASTGALVEGGSVVGGALPTLTRNDSYTLRLRLLEKQTNGLFEDVDLTSATLKAGIGNDRGRAFRWVVQAGHQRHYIIRHSIQRHGGLRL